MKAKLVGGVETVGTAKKTRKRITLNTEGLEAYRVGPVIYFPNAIYEGQQYQVFLVPTWGVKKTPAKT
jgi:hypothetical protein